MKKIIFIASLVAVISSGLTMAITYWFVGRQQGQPLRVEHVNNLPARETNYNAALTASGLDFTAAAARVVDAVVHIKSTQTRQPSRSEDPQAGFPDLFRDFFGERFFRFEGPRQPQPRVGTGSGVIINQDGYIVTNNHVIASADDVEVTLHDNRSYKASIIGVDPTTDLALLRIKETGLPHLSFADSDGVLVGQWVLAVGNPFSLTSTVTAGIVSAKGRNINILQEQFAVESFIQTDAAINPGNSGGALVNLQGEVIGINTAIASPTGAYAGYGFAIPANIAEKVVRDLMEFGSVQRGVLGIMIRTVDGNFAREKQLSVNSGVYVDSLLEGSAAGAAGIQPEDVIMAIDGERVASSPQLQERIARKRPGDKVELLVNRKGKERAFTVTLVNPQGKKDLIAKSDRELSRVLGADFENVSKEQSAKLDIAGGVVVKRLLPGKLRRQTQIREGFIITKVDGKIVRNVEDFAKALEGKTGGVMLEGVYPDTPGTHYYAFGMDS
jgi:serine protease Do